MQNYLVLMFNVHRVFLTNFDMFSKDRILDTTFHRNEDANIRYYQFIYSKLNHFSFVIKSLLHNEQLIVFH